MKKTLATIIMALFFAVGVNVTLEAKSIECTVASIADSIVTLNCGKKADKVAVGSTVKVKAAKKKAIEGC